MPAEHRADPTWLDVVATQLARSSTAALEASHELLAHYSDTGDAKTQRAVDALINRAADVLGTLTDSLADTSRALQEAAHQATTSRAATSRVATSQAATSRDGDTDGSCARSGRTHDQGT
ncbi:MAG: hypothetical protein ACYDDU_02865 [Dermatophilaceae bacterium]